VFYTEDDVNLNFNSLNVSLQSEVVVLLVGNLRIALIASHYFPEIFDVIGNNPEANKCYSVNFSDFPSNCYLSSVCNVENYLLKNQAAIISSFLGTTVGTCCSAGVVVFAFLFFRRKKKKTEKMEKNVTVVEVANELYDEKDGMGLSDSNPLFDAP